MAKLKMGLLAVALLSASAAHGVEPSRIIDGAWYDGGGSEVVLTGDSFRKDPIAPGTRHLGDLVKLFADACLNVPIGTAAAKPAIEKRRDWQFRYIDADAGTRPGARLDGWQASDVTVSSHWDTWPLAECNVLAARSFQEEADAVGALITASLSIEPVKRGNVRRADGGKVQGTTWRWDVNGPGGAARHIYASIVKQTDRYFLHLGVTELRPRAQ